MRAKIGMSLTDVSDANRKLRMDIATACVKKWRYQGISYEGSPAMGDPFPNVDALKENTELLLNILKPIWQKRPSQIVCVPSVFAALEMPGVCFSSNDNIIKEHFGDFGDMNEKIATNSAWFDSAVSHKIIPAHIDNSRIGLGWSPSKFHIASDALTERIAEKFGHPAWDKGLMLTANLLRVLVELEQSLFYPSPFNTPAIRIWLDMLWGVGGLLLIGNVVAQFPRPIAVFDDRNRLHSDNGKALYWYRDKRGWYYWHGVHVPEKVVLTPNLIAPQEIAEEKNAEVRRVMIERLGAEKFIKGIGALLKHKDETGELFSYDFAISTGQPIENTRQDSVIQMIRVLNSTAEPDGSRKEYWLRVPPTVNTAKEAVAWTFDMGEEEYAPEQET